MKSNETEVTPTGRENETLQETDLPPLAQEAKEHWKEFQPTMYSRLESEGTLDQTLIKAEKRTRKEMNELNQAGYEDYEAREIVYPKYLFLRDEAEDEDPDGELTASPMANLHQEIIKEQQALMEKADLEEANL